MECKILSRSKLNSVKWPIALEILFRDEKTTKNCHINDTTGPLKFRESGQPISKQNQLYSSFSTICFTLGPIWTRGTVSFNKTKQLYLWQCSKPRLLQSSLTPSRQLCNWVTLFKNRSTHPEFFKTEIHVQNSVLYTWLQRSLLKSLQTAAETCLQTCNNFSLAKSFKIGNSMWIFFHTVD
jgi:hypothetical protein